jgi:hypothetical protein
MLFPCSDSTTTISLACESMPTTLPVNDAMTFLDGTTYVITVPVPRTRSEWNGVECNVETLGSGSQSCLNHVCPWRNCGLPRPESRQVFCDSPIPRKTPLTFCGGLNGNSVQEAYECSRVVVEFEVEIPRRVIRNQVLPPERHCIISTHNNLGRGIADFNIVEL